MEKKTMTIRKSEPLESVFPMIKDAPLPTMEEQQDILLRLQQGSPEAEEELKKANIRFVASVAKQYVNRGLSNDELLRIGMEGLVIAGQKYDPARGIKFISYAVSWVRQSILSALEDYESNESENNQ